MAVKLQSTLESPGRLVLLQVAESFPVSDSLKWNPSLSSLIVLIFLGDAGSQSVQNESGGGRKGV